MRLTKIEKEFILESIRLSDGVFDYSIDDTDFKNRYGITKNEAFEMLKKFKSKVLSEKKIDYDIKLRTETQHPY